MIRRHRRPILASALVALMALVAAGCGGPSKQDYETGLGRVSTQLDAAGDASRDLLAAEDDAARAAALRTAQQNIERAAKTARELDPPKDVRDTHDKLADALADYARVYGELAALDDGDPARTELIGEAGQIAKRLEAANRELEKAGYEVPGKDDA